MSGREMQFPFSALVGQEALKTALIVNAIDPSIGGVLIRGQKGTGKTTAVRSFRSVLPPIRAVKGCVYHCPPDTPAEMCGTCLERFEKGEHLEEERIPIPLVDLPLNATEDRIVGTLQLEVALHEGRRKFEPGLLAAANRGILYIDEVNLLEDHLVDLLLDAAAMGVNRVEREGVSFSHPARFILVGTMNPEEGELRPQFLDRFGLCVQVSTLSSPNHRAEIVRRKIQYEADPTHFMALWEQEERLLSHCIVDAQNRLSRYTVSEETLAEIVRLTEQAGTAGHRAEITIYKTARALAAFTEAEMICREHIREAARLVLPHRIELGPFQDERNMLERIDALTEGKELPAKSHVSGATLKEEAIYQEEYGIDPTVLEEMQVPGSTAAGSIVFEFLKKKRYLP
ncbi:MAG: ATP-binding protein [Spirochaetes bacterium]|nr:ATP-binding protein [Spirochaetota bacterium]